MILGLDVFWPEVGKILGFLGVSSDSRQPNRPNRVPVFLGVGEVSYFTQIWLIDAYSDFTIPNSSKFTEFR